MLLLVSHRIAVALHSIEADGMPLIAESPIDPMGKTHPPASIVPIVRMKRNSELAESGDPGEMLLNNANMPGRCLMMERHNIARCGCFAEYSTL
jgi:hypothetical protein